jgi:hypothetical protein
VRISPLFKGTPRAVPDNSICVLGGGEGADLEEGDKDMRCQRRHQGEKRGEMKCLGFPR